MVDTPVYLGRTQANSCNQPENGGKDGHDINPVPGYAIAYNAFHR